MRYCEFSHETDAGAGPEEGTQDMTLNPHDLDFSSLEKAVDLAL